MWIITVWTDPELAIITWQWDLTGVLLTATTAIASLILLLVQHPSLLVRGALAVTFAFLFLATAASLVAIWLDQALEVDGLYRLTGILWILTGLGVVLVPASALLLRRSGQGTLVPASAALSDRSIQRLSTAAQARGLTPDELVDELLGPKDISRADDRC